MGGAAVTEKAVLSRIGAKPQVSDRTNTGPFQPLGDIARQIEAEMSRPVGGNKQAAVTFREPGAQILAHFIIGLRDGRPNNGGDMSRPGPKPFPGGERVL